MAKLGRYRSRVLRKCGYVRKKAKGRAGEERWVLEVDGDLKRITSCPRGKGDIAKGTFSKMLQQLGLSAEEHAPLYSCKERRHYYFEILRAQGIDV